MKKKGKKKNVYKIRKKPVRKVKGVSNKKKKGNTRGTNKKKSGKKKKELKHTNFRFHAVFEEITTVDYQGVKAGTTKIVNMVRNIPTILMTQTRFDKKILPSHLEYEQKIFDDISLNTHGAKVFKLKKVLYTTPITKEEIEEDE